MMPFPWVYRLTKIPFTIFLTVMLASRSSHSRATRSLYARSIVDLQNLEQFEMQVVRNLTEGNIFSTNSLLKHESAHTIWSYLQDFQKASGSNIFSEEMNKKTILSSYDPICTYRLIRRVKLLRNVVARKVPYSLGSLRRQIILYFWRNGWPQLDDLQLAIEKILAIQVIHDLDTYDLARGWIYNNFSPCTLNSIHCYEIGTVALKTEQYSLAIPWLELAKEKATVDRKIGFAFVDFALQKAIENHNADFDADVKDNLDERFFNRKIRHYVNQDFKKSQRLRKIRHEKYRGRNEQKYQKINYMGICAGENYQPEEEKSHLFCWYEYRAHSRFTIAPAKMEFLSRNPDIVQIYEFLNLKERQRLKQDASTKATDFTPHAHTTKKKGQKSRSKWGMDALLPNNQNLTALLRKIEHLTGLNFVNEKTPEPLLVESFSSGGHSYPRIARKRKNSKDLEGNQMATVMLYLNDVENGGGTAFTSVGMEAKPFAGSAVFWYDVFSDGVSVDDATVYGACPVLLGEKWVLSKRIRLDDQSLVQKCSLRADERIEVPVNKMLLPHLTEMQTKIQNENLPIVTQRGAPAGTEHDFVKYSSFSPHGLTALVQLEWELYPRIRNLYQRYKSRTHGTFRQEFEKNNRDILLYLQDFESCTKNAVQDLEHLPIEDLKIVKNISLNPLAAYKTISRFINYFIKWVSKTHSEGNQLMSKIVSLLNKTYDSCDGPLEHDLETSMFALLRLHFIYEFPLEEIVRGYIDGTDTNITLNAKDFFLIGMEGVSRQYYTAGIEWLQYALFLVQNTSDNSIQPDVVHDELISAEFSHDENYGHKVGSAYHYFEKRVDKVPERSQRVPLKSTLHKFYPPSDSASVDRMLWSVCAGKTSQSEEEKSKLFCYYESEIHPSYKIGPVKAEFHSILPQIEVVQFYDVISDEMIEALKNFSTANFRRLMMANSPFDPFGSEILRAFDREIQSAAAVKSVRLLERLTGFEAKSVTDLPLHLFAYGPGSARGKHFDEKATLTEAALSTFLFYLSDVEKGGETLFHHMGLKITPKKGSALYWFNYYSCGTLDERSEHASCPIIFGEKWLYAKDITFMEQDHFQCNRQPETIQEILVNGKTKYL